MNGCSTCSPEYPIGSTLDAVLPSELLRLIDLSEPGALWAPCSEKEDDEAQDWLC